MRKRAPDKTSHITDTRIRYVWAMFPKSYCAQASFHGLSVNHYKNLMYRRELFTDFINFTFKDLTLYSLLRFQGMGFKAIAKALGYEESMHVILRMYAERQQWPMRLFYYVEKSRRNRHLQRLNHHRVAPKDHPRNADAPPVATERPSEPTDEPPVTTEGPAEPTDDLAGLFQENASSLPEDDDSWMDNFNI